MKVTTNPLGLIALALTALCPVLPAQEPPPHPTHIQPMHPTAADPEARGRIILELITRETLRVTIEIVHVSSADEVVFLVNGRPIGEEVVIDGHARLRLVVPLAEALPILRTDPRVAVRNAETGELILFAQVDVID